MLDYALTSAMFADLSVDAAARHATEARAAGAHPDDVWPRLLLAGFLNPSGHRNWRREIVEDIGGWR